eukprot:TRINITY_DN3085_c0_g2_i3.p2 TRINITY_DN3085_c0_g2~~TRINITY_DN3085_c0_g2_i3.p2  ORF type:complete len:172 (-),score=9.26 TRINITY_DN3085_c0_g2_i3:224-739(-)
MSSNINKVFLVVFLIVRAAAFFPFYVNRPRLFCPLNECKAVCEQYDSEYAYAFTGCDSIRSRSCAGFNSDAIIRKFLEERGVVLDEPLSSYKRVDMTNKVDQNEVDCCLCGVEGESKFNFIPLIIVATILPASIVCSACFLIIRHRHRREQSNSSAKQDSQSGGQVELSSA